MPTKYDNWTASDAIDKSLLDSDIHYLHGDIASENVGSNQMDSFCKLKQETKTYP